MLSILSTNVLADDYCYCNLYALRPLAGSRQTDPLKLTQVKLDYFEDYSADSQTQCVQSCQIKAAQEIRLYKEDIEIWTKNLIVNDLHGKHCTGPTDVKVPVRAKASLGNYSIGLAHESMVFIHHPHACKF